MVKLTPELVEQAVQYVNPVRERELILRGYKIPVIENLGATLDQFDTIDFSDNDIRKFDGFPLLKRLKSLMFNNNRICRIADDVHENIPNVKELYLTNNELAQLTDIDQLAGFKHLEFVSLMRNPVAHHREYRLYTIFKLPHVRVLDFCKVKQKERDAANQRFGSKQGKTLLDEISQKSKTFVPGKPTTENDVVSAATQKDKEAIKNAILKASSLEEVEKLKRMLQAGKIPGKDVALNGDGQRNE